MNRGITAEIDLSAIAFNLDKVKKITGRPVIAVVKADAYGHGAVEVSKALEKRGVLFLAVAFTEEALKLRASGVRSPILVLFEKSDLKSFFDFSLTPVLHDIKTARAFASEARKRNTVLDVHVKADTGMGRMGFSVNSSDILALLKMPNLRVSGLLSHFSEADLSDRQYAEEQLRRFISIKAMILKTPGLAAQNRSRPGLLCHMANSAAVLNLKDSYFDAVRPGLILYGCPPVPPAPKTVPRFKIAMKAYTKIVALRRLKKGQAVSYGRTFITTRNTLAAVLAVGYADGYMRSLSNNSHVIIRGRRAPVIGRICMDLTVADATGIKGVEEGDRALLLGSEGKEAVTAWELAKWAKTIPYEIFTSFGGRAKKLFTSGGDR